MNSEPTALLEPREAQAGDASSRPQPAPVPGDLRAATIERRRNGSISCIVPGLNESRNLLRLLPQLAEMLQRETGRWEVIVVDDGSTDGTVEALRHWWHEVPGFRVVQLSRNFGKEAALTAGLAVAQGDAIVLMDADLQHPVDLVPRLIAEWRRGADVAYTVRENRADEPAFNRWGAHAFYRLLNGTQRFTIPPGAGDFRLMDRAVAEALLALPERNRVMKGLYAWVGFESVAVPYMPAPREHGQTSFNAWRLWETAIDALTGFTTWPLRALSMLGTIFALAAFGYGAYLTIVYFVYGHVVSGWTTIVDIILFFSGVQMLSLGIVGEYVGRIFEEVKARPLYLVKRELGRGLPPRAS